MARSLLVSGSLPRLRRPRLVLGEDMFRYHRTIVYDYAKRKVKNQNTALSAEFVFAPTAEENYAKVRVVCVRYAACQ